MDLSNSSEQMNNQCSYLNFGIVWLLPREMINKDNDDLKIFQKTVNIVERHLSKHSVTAYNVNYAQKQNFPFLKCHNRIPHSKIKQHLKFKSLFFLFTYYTNDE